VLTTALYHYLAVLHAVHPRLLAVNAFITAEIFLMAAVLVYGSLKSHEEVAKFYLENSTFVSGGATSIMGQPDYQPENAAPEDPLKPAEAVETDASNVLRQLLFHTTAYSAGNSATCGSTNVTRWVALKR
jgi:hypothetical protein